MASAALVAATVLATISPQALGFNYIDHKLDEFFADRHYDGEEPADLGDFAFDLASVYSPNVWGNKVFEEEEPRGVGSVPRGNWWPDPPGSEVSTTSSSPSSSSATPYKRRRKVFKVATARINRPQPLDTSLLGYRTDIKNKENLSNHRLDGVPEKDPADVDDDGTDLVVHPRRMSSIMKSLVPTGLIMMPDSMFNMFFRQDQPEDDVFRKSSVVFEPSLQIPLFPNSSLLNSKAITYMEALGTTTTTTTTAKTTLTAATTPCPCALGQPGTAEPPPRQIETIRNINGFPYFEEDLIGTKTNDLKPISHSPAEKSPPVPPGNQGGALLVPSPIRAPAPPPQRLPLPRNVHGVRPILPLRRPSLRRPPLRKRPSPGRIAIKPRVKLTRNRSRRPGKKPLNVLRSRRKALMVPRRPDKVRSFRHPGQPVFKRPPPPALSPPHALPQTSHQGHPGHTVKVPRRKMSLSKLSLKRRHHGRSSKTMKGLFNGLNDAASLSAKLLLAIMFKSATGI